MVWQGVAWLGESRIIGQARHGTARLGRARRGLEARPGDARLGRAWRGKARIFFFSIHTHQNEPPTNHPRSKAPANLNP